jgi:DNA-binding winged helix-turn-helix (wHTH) protein
MEFTAVKASTDRQRMPVKLSSNAVLLVKQLGRPRPAVARLHPRGARCIPRARDYAPRRSTEVALLSFSPFRLDLADERLWKDGKELRLRRKPFAILKHFVQHPRRLVTHDEIVEAVWGKIAMSESLVRTHVRDLRRALGDDIIETVVGRGYRFLADVKEGDNDASSAATAKPEAPPSEAMVGRGAELGVLDEALEGVRERRRSTVFVTGDPGVGKTALVDTFVERARARGTLWVARGSCVEQYGSGEAYLPVLDALGGLCRGPGGERVVDVLLRHAPTWLAQMPSLVPESKLEELQRRVAGAAQPRMLREMAEAVEALSVEAPVVLALDDLQWSDPSTLDLIAMLGRRRDPARVLVVCAYRPSGVAATSTLPRIADELVAHRQAALVRLEPFAEPTLGAYLDKRFPGHALPPALARTIHKMTGGNPLFVVTLLEDLVTRGMIRETERGWELAARVDDVSAQRPDNIRRLIDTQIDRLTATEQRILEVASVAGVEFAVGAVAHALDAEVDEVDSTCETLADGRRFLEYVGTEPWPDGSIHARYAFAHALIQHAALARSPSASVRLWHRKIAERLETGYAGREEDVAGELAVHFERGQRPAQAARHYVAAGERAARRFADVEAAAHFERALGLLPQVADRPDHDRLELRAAYGLGMRQFQLRGAASLPALERARDVAARLDDREMHATALLRLQMGHIARGNFRDAEAHAAVVARAVERTQNPVFRERAVLLEAVAAVYRGRFAEAQRIFEALSIQPAGGEPPGTHTLPAYANAAFVSLLIGRPDESLALIRRAYATTEATGDPFERAAILCEWSSLHAWRREPDKALELATRSLAIAEDNSFALWKDRARTVVLWARAHLQPTAEKDVQGLCGQQWDSGDGGRTLYASLVAATASRVGREDHALAIIEGALGQIERTDERLALAELHRLRGEVLKSRDAAEAERALRAAADVAREQSALLFELRATVSLHALVGGAKKKRARDDLARLLAEFAEGRDAPDVVDAKAVLGG